ncbi:MAG: tetratricopeptide repeat protein [Planctomycetaceae bacterium]|nr:tetratricopeptide repeat protein [Planctomycetaceae bacterium]MBT6483225.1 tetratricopeptide repeat protein [Planctomycetaceae bacterium]
MTATQPLSSHHNRRRFLLFGLLVAAVASVVVAISVLSKNDVPAEELLQAGTQAFDRGDYNVALASAVEVLAVQPKNAQAALLAGESAAGLQRFDEALEYLERLPDDGSAEAVSARCAAGKLLLLGMQRLSPAEQQFRRALDQDPENIVAHDHMAFLLGLGSRNWELIPHRLAIIRSNRFNSLHLYVLCFGDDVLENPELVEQYLAVTPDDPVLLTAVARIAVEDGEYGRAKQLLRQVVRSHPDVVEAQVKLGRLLWETTDESEFVDWHAQLTESANSHPGIWAIRGAWADRQADVPVSIRCYWETLRRDPNHKQANYQLGRLLGSLGKNQQASPFLERSRLLQLYANTVKVAHTDRDATAAKKAAELAESLGLLWEAYGWSQLSLQHDPQTDWAARIVSRLGPKLPTLPPARTVPKSNLALEIDLSEYPLPRWSSQGIDKTKPGAPKGPDAGVAFVDRASEAGLIFRYDNAAKSPELGPMRMNEFSGGGVAVLDFDGNGWPDLHMTQGCSWPPQEENFDLIDRLFRNDGNGRFEDVTEHAGLANNGFGQGVTVGDFNADGFPDLFLSNIGRNRLFQNNGDGTFSDVTDAAGIGGERWTTSSLLADLNGDGLADIYAVNYLSGSDVFTRICGTPEKPGICLPQSFPAEQDRLFLNLGDGRFEDVTEATGIVVSDGKGMGIVAADFDGSGKLSLFIANDTLPNFYLANQTTDHRGPPIFTERALPIGLALNDRGRAEACMGIATGDANSDGLLDLFVTNFLKESNTLFLQGAGQMFLDATRKAGLHEDSIGTLGFGTQFLDGNLDGNLDLIITNGHIGEFTETGDPYKMPPQYFHNMGEGRFVELKGRSLGPYFQDKYLGRALAKVDWNRDGLEDVVISHLDSSAALLTNTTSDAGNFVAIRLVGVESSRDAIGTTLTAEIQGRKLVRQLTAGDGYQASNERRVVFGLGDRQQIDVLNVRWPSGSVQRFENLPANSELLMVEGRTYLRLVQPE